jgi:glycosyltransferase 2 family protein
LNPRQRSNARLLVGLVVGGLTLWLTFRGIDLGVLRTTLGGLNYWFVLWGVASVVVTVIVATIRWRALLSPGNPALAWRPIFESVVVGQMLNIILPIRAGDFVRAYALGRIEGIAMGGVVATIAIEKAADLLAQGVAMAVLLLGYSFPVGLTGSARASIILGAVALIAGVVATRYSDWTLNRIARLPLVPEPYRAVLARHGASTIQGFAALHEAKAIVALWILTALTVGLAASTNYLLFKAFGLDLPVSAAFLLLVVLQFGNAPVSTPGNLGVYHYLTVLVLSAFSVDRPVAVAYAVVLYAVALAPKIILGTVIIAVPGHGSWYRTTFADYLTTRARA